MADDRLQYERQFQIEEARRAVKLALVRSLSFQELLYRYESICTDDSASEVIFAIQEKLLDAPMAEALALVIRAHMAAAAVASSKERQKIDRYVALLIPFLPINVRLPLLSEYLEDNRKTRREVGFRSLKRSEIEPQLASYLRMRFFVTGDTRFLKFALRVDAPLSAAEARQMISAFNDEGDEYWGVRVIQSQLDKNRELALQLASAYPKEFIWACGRSGNTSWVPDIRRIFQAANDKIPLLGIVVWAFGKLGALAELREMNAILNELEKSSNY